MKKDSTMKIILFIAITYGVTWALWGIAYNLNIGIFRILGSFVPSIVAIAYCRVSIADRLMLRNIKPGYFIFICWFSFISLLLPSLIVSIFTSGYNIKVNTEPMGFDLYNPLSVVLLFISILIAGGPLGEEIGWRGFLLPELQKKTSTVIAALLVGIIWACWHLPMFIFHIDGYEFSFLIYLLQTVCLSVIFTWLYCRTKGSLLIVILFHTIDNFVMLIMCPDYVNGINCYVVCYYALLILVAVVLSVRLKNGDNTKVD